MTATRAGLLRRLSALVCVLLVALGSAAGTSYAAQPAADDGYREPQRPTSFEDGLWWFDALRLDQAHRQVTGKGATVALIDEGIAPSVPELRGQDVVLKRYCDGTPVRVQPTLDPDHGTGMAALIVGSGRGNAPGGAGVTGVAPGARLLYFATDTLCSVEEDAGQVDAAVRSGADIISISQDWAGVPVLEAAIDRAVDAGVVVVAAAGNRTDTFQIHPSGYPGVVSVGAVDEYAQRWKRYSAEQRTVIAAPGVQMVSGGFPEGTWQSYSYGTGTSYATAITAGALALVKSKYPEATGNQLIQHLIHTPRGSDGFDYDPGYGFGIVNVTGMLKSSPTQWPDENPVLKGPRHTMNSYPMWVSSRIEDPPGKGENATVAQQSDGQDNAEAASSAGSAGGSDTGQAAPAQDDAGSGLPAWGWVLLAVAVVIVAAVATMSRRVRRPGDVVRHG